MLHANANQKAKHPRLVKKSHTETMSQNDAMSRHVSTSRGSSPHRFAELAR